MHSPFPAKHAELQVTGVEYFPKRFLDRLEAGLDRLLALIPWPTPYTDLEVTGSYGCNCARPDSDLDISIRFPDEAAQKAAWDVYRKWHGTPGYLAAKYALRHELGILIQIGLRNHDSRTYWPVYSLRERKLYQRQIGEVRELHGKWDDVQKRWVERQLPTPEQRAARRAELAALAEANRWRQDGDA